MNIDLKDTFQMQDECDFRSSLDHTVVLNDKNH